MRIIAFLLLSIFSLVQVAPAIINSCDKTVVSLFNPDEEKGSDKTQSAGTEELKEKKNHSQYFDMALSLYSPSKCFTTFEISQKLPMAVVDMLTPPPNFS